MEFLLAGANREGRAMAPFAGGGLNCAMTLETILDLKTFSARGQFRNMAPDVVGYFVMVPMDTKALTETVEMVLPTMG